MVDGRHQIPQFSGNLEQAIELNGNGNGNACGGNEQVNRNRQTIPHADHSVHL